MSSTTINQVVISAETAADNALNRHLTEQCKEEESTELFDFQMIEKTFEVFINYSTFYFEPFTKANRPQETKCILAIIKTANFEQGEYQIIVKPTATSEMIQNDLMKLVLPF